MKILSFCKLAVIIGTLFIAQPANAQSDDPALIRSFERLNASPAVRSPEFKSNSYVLSTRILDSNRQLMGYVRDTLMFSSGELAYLDAEITRVAGSPHRLYDADEAVFHDNVGSWVVSLDSFEKTVDRNPLFNMKAMIGAEVKDIGGGWLGKVKYVLMDDQANQIKALVLNEVPGAGRYDDMTLPFDTDFVTIRKQYDTVEFRVNRAHAQSFRDFARENR